MINDVMVVVTKVYFPVLMPFVLLLMSVALSGHVIDVIKLAIDSRDSRR